MFLSHGVARLPRRRGLAGLSVGLVLVLVQGCASLPAESPEVLVKQRAEILINSLLSGDRDTAFAYTTPAYQSSSTPTRLAGRYAGMATWTNAEVGDVSCEAQRCVVKIMITYRMIRPPIENTRPIDQVWVNTGGNWYYYPSA